MKNSFGHEDAASAMGEELTYSLDNIIRNNTIEDFLNNDNKCYVIGTKGSGKTLLLLKKSITKRKNNSSVIFIPKNEPVDRCLFDDHNIGQELYSKTKNDQSIWMLVWRNTIFKTCLFNQLDSNGNFTKKTDTGYNNESTKAYQNKIKQLITTLFGEPPYIRTGNIFDFYIEVIKRLESGGHGKNFKNLRADIIVENSTMSNLISKYLPPAYIYIDDLDNYYEQNPDLWTASIFGLFKLIREIRIDIKHIHIYTTIRKDIYNQFETEHIMEYNDFISFLDYRKENLIAIFENGIKSLEDAHLADPSSKNSDPWHSFFGTLMEDFKNNIINKKEDIKEYIIRHTLWRPRDIVVMGNKIIGEMNGNKITSGKLIEAIQEGETLIRDQYFAEIQHIFNKDNIVLRELITPEYISSNTITQEELKDACEKYNKKQGREKQCDGKCNQCPLFDVGRTLYLLGLLGIVELSAQEGEYLQKFILPGKKNINNQNEKLPSSTHYILHPILNNLLGIPFINTNLIVGHRKPFI